MDNYSINGLAASAALWNRLYSPASTGAVLVGGVAGGSTDANPTAEAASAMLVAAFAAFGDAFRTLSNEQTPVYATSLVSTAPELATLSGQSARRYPVYENYSDLETSQPINSQTSNVQASAFDLGLDLSTAAASRLYSFADLGIDLTSPQAASLLQSAQVLGLDTSSPDAASKLYSALALALDINSAEDASRLASAALGLDLTSPDAASKLLSSQALALDVTTAQAESVLKSNAGLNLDVSSAQRASTIASTAEINTATSSYGSTVLNFSGSGAQSTSVGSLTGVYMGLNSAANATSLTLKMRAGVSAMNGLLGSMTRFDVLDNTGAAIFSFDGNLKAGDKVYLGDDIGLSVSFSAGSLTNAHTASTTVSNAKVDVDADASFNNANPSLRPKFDNSAQVSAGSFKVNGTSVNVQANDTINTVLARINATVAGVTASFADDKITIASNGFSEDNIDLSHDTSGFLNAVKLAGATAVRGNVSDDQQTLAKTTQFGAVASGSFSINGVAIAVDKNADTLSSIIGKINGSAAGVTAAFDSAQNKLVLSSTGNSEDLIAVTGDTSGFVAAAKLTTAIRGNVRDDLQVLAKTSQFADVSSGTFTINGVSISVDKNTDSLDSLATRISNSGAGVSAAYDATADKLVLTSTSNSMDLIDVGADSTGFLAAAHLQTGNTVRGHLSEDTVALRNLSRFSTVTDGSFVVDGKTINLSTGDTIQSIADKINNSAARVSAAFNASTNKFELTTNNISEDEIAIGSDTSGFLSAAGISSANTVRGNLRDDQQVLAKTSQFGAVESGQFSINGVAIAVDKNTDTLTTLLERINAAGIGVTAAYDQALDKLVLTGTSNSMDLIKVDGDNTGFLAAAGLQTGNTVRGHLAEDTVALVNLSQFAGVTNGSFVIDGKTIDVDAATDSVQSLIGKINGSGARVVASYDRGNDRITLQSADNSEDEIGVGSDTSGFLAAARLNAADTVKGNIRDDQQTLAKTAQFGNVANGSFDINGKTISVDAENDSMASVIDKINAADAGVSARFDVATNRIELLSTTFGEDLIEVGNDSSGFLAAAKLVAGNTERGNLPDDQQVFAKTAQFAGVTSGAFSVNGVTISVDVDNDTLQSVIGRLNGAGAGVSAGYDSASGKLVITPDTGDAALLLEDNGSGFLAAAGIATGAFSTRFNPNAAFNADGLDSPFFDQGRSVQAGSFKVNGVDIAVAADDNVNAVLARITASSAGVSAAYDSDTQTVKLSRSDGTSTAISVTDDSSGFLAAVKLDASAMSRNGGNASSSFDATLGKMSEYSKVRSGTLTLNGQAIAIDTESTTVRGLVSAINGIDGIQASLDESSGRIKITAKKLGDSINLSDTSGVLAALGLAGGTYNGSPGSTRAVETLAGTTTTSNAGDVVNKVAQAAESANAALLQLGKLRDGGQFRSKVESLLRSAINDLGEAGLNGLALGRNTRGLGLLLDRNDLTAALAGLSGGTEGGPGAAAGDLLDKLGQQITALAAPPAAAASTSAKPLDRDQVREQLKAVFQPGPVTNAWVLDLVQSARLQPVMPPTAKRVADVYSSEPVDSKQKTRSDRFDPVPAGASENRNFFGNPVRKFGAVPAPDGGPARWSNNPSLSSSKLGVA